MPGMLTLEVITTQTYDTYNRATGASLKALEAWVRHPGGACRLADLDNKVNRVLGPVGGLAVSVDGAPAELGEPLRGRLLKVLAEGVIDDRFDCQGLVHYLFGLGVIGYAQWAFEPLCEVPPPGAAVALRDQGGGVAHLALSLGRNCYLSKAGLRGRLRANDLENLMAGYGGETAWAITPRAS